MIPMMTYLKSDGTTYISSAPMDCCDIQVPENPYGVNGKFDKTNHIWIEDIDKIAAEKLAESKKEMSNTVLAGFEYTFKDTKYLIKYNTFDQINFNDTINGITIDPESYIEIKWYGYTEDGIRVVLTFTKDEFIELYKAALKFKNSILKPTE